MLRRKLGAQKGAETCQGHEGSQASCQLQDLLHRVSVAGEPLLRSVAHRRPPAHFPSLLSCEWFNLPVLLPFMSQAASLLPLISEVAQTRALLVGPPLSAQIRRLSNCD